MSRMEAREQPPAKARSNSLTGQHAPRPKPPQRSASTVSAASVGAGDSTLYWDFLHRTVAKNDLGHVCRECRKPFTQLGAELVERRGARLALRYHKECFSGLADPRSQPQGPFQSGKWAGSTAVRDEAPYEPFRKMRTTSHFDAGTSRVQGVTRSGLRPSV